MDSEVKRFIENIDSWVKNINHRVKVLEENSLKLIVSENLEDIQHNYELIYEIKEEVEGLNQEINALKLIQILSLKKGVAQSKLPSKKTL